MLHPRKPHYYYVPQTFLILLCSTTILSSPYKSEGPSLDTHYDNWCDSDVVFHAHHDPGLLSERSGQAEDCQNILPCSLRNHFLCFLLNTFLLLRQWLAHVHFGSPIKYISIFVCFYIYFCVLLYLFFVCFYIYFLCACED